MNTGGFEAALQKQDPGAVNVLHRPVLRCYRSGSERAGISQTKRSITMRYTKSLFCELLLKADLLRRINAAPVAPLMPTVTSVPVSGAAMA